MRAIVADTSPLNYLILVQAAEILPRLFQKVLIPPGVRDELAHPKAPVLVRRWISKYPPWMNVVSVTDAFDSAFAHLETGEREAIALASEQRAEILLMDDRDGVRVARNAGLNVVGTLSVLDEAAMRGWIDLQTIFERLGATTFRSPKKLMAAMLEQDGRRRQRSR